MAKMTRLIENMIVGIERASGRKPDVIVVQNDTKAEEVRESLQELGRDMNVIVDDEYCNPNTLIVTNTEDLAKFPGGGRN